MAKKYDLGKKSDMRRFEREFNENIRKATIDSVNNATFDVQCPICDKDIKVSSGKNRCRYCGDDITVDFDFV